MTVKKLLPGSCPDWLNPKAANLIGYTGDKVKDNRETVTIRLVNIIFTDEDGKNKGLRKDLNYLTKLFGRELPKWLVNNILKIRRKKSSIIK